MKLDNNNMQNELNHLFKNFVFAFLSVLSLKLDILLAKSNLLFYINLENYIKHHMLRKYADIAHWSSWTLYMT